MTIREGDIKVKIHYIPNWMSLLITHNGKILLNLFPSSVVCKVKEKRGLFYRTVCTLRYASDKNLDNSRFTLFNKSDDIYSFSHTNKDLDNVIYNCKLCYVSTKKGLPLNTSDDRKKAIKEFDTCKVINRRKKLLSKILN